MDNAIIEVLSSDDENVSIEPSYIVEPKVKRRKLNIRTSNDIGDFHLFDDKNVLSPSTFMHSPSDAEVAAEGFPQEEICENVLNNEIPAFFQKFVDECISRMSNESLINKIKAKSILLFKAFKNVMPYSHSDEFKKIVVDYTVNLENEPAFATTYFSDVYNHLKSHRQYKSLEDSVNTDLDRLYDTLKSLDVKIQKFEEEEVDLDNEDSSYIKMQCYRKHAAKVYAMIKSLEKSDPLCCRLYYSPLDYSHSKHIEINHAINRTFKSRKKIPFPTYKQVDECIRQCVANSEKLNMSESQISAEVRFNFEHLGNLIQRKRKHDLVQIHYESFIKNCADPALNDPVLDALLRENKSMSTKTLDETFQKFTDAKWDESQELSDDLDDSHDDSSDNEEVEEQE